MLWDGKSQGSYNNIVELLNQNKKALVYFAPKKDFMTIKNKADLNLLVHECDASFKKNLNVKTSLSHQTPQQALEF